MFLINKVQLILKNFFYYTLIFYCIELSHLKLRKKQTLSKHDQSLIAMKKGVKAEPGALKDL